jgi:hypothetical protein
VLIMTKGISLRAAAQFLKSNNCLQCRSRKNCGARVGQSEWAVNEDLCVLAELGCAMSPPFRIADDDDNVPGNAEFMLGHILSSSGGSCSPTSISTIRHPPQTLCAW